MEFNTVQATSLGPSSGSNTSVNNKAKGVFTTFDHSDPESEDSVSTSAHIVAGNSNWIKPGSNYKFPFPLQNHDHKIAACSEFLMLTPKIPRGCICYTCLKPKGANGVYKARQCTEENSILQVLLCAAFTPWAAAKGWASFSILMCRKQEHGKNQPKPTDVRKFLEKFPQGFLIINSVMQLTLITRCSLFLIY